MRRLWRSLSGRLSSGRFAMIAATNGRMTSSRVRLPSAEDDSIMTPTLISRARRPRAPSCEATTTAPPRPQQPRITERRCRLTIRERTCGTGRVRAPRRAPRLGAAAVEAVARGKDPAEGAQDRLLAPAVGSAATPDGADAFYEASDQGKEQVERGGAEEETLHNADGTAASMGWSSAPAALFRR